MRETLTGQTRVSGSTGLKMLGVAGIRVNDQQEERGVVGRKRGLAGGTGTVLGEDKETLQKVKTSRN